MTTKEMNSEDVKANLITEFRGRAYLLKQAAPVSISKVTARVYLNEGLEKPFLVKARAYIRDFLDVDFIDSAEATMLDSAMTDLVEKVAVEHGAWVTARQQKLDKLRYEAARIGYELVEKEGGLL